MSHGGLHSLEKVATTPSSLAAAAGGSLMCAAPAAGGVVSNLGEPTNPSSLPPGAGGPLMPAGGLHTEVSTTLSNLPPTVGELPACCAASAACHSQPGLILTKESSVNDDSPVETLQQHVLMLTGSLQSGYAPEEQKEIGLAFAENFRGSSVPAVPFDPGGSRKSYDGMWSNGQATSLDDLSQTSGKFGSTIWAVCDGGKLTLNCAKGCHCLGFLSALSFLLVSVWSIGTAIRGCSSKVCGCSAVNGGLFRGLQLQPVQIADCHINSGML